MGGWWSVYSGAKITKEVEDEMNAKDVLAMLPTVLNLIGTVATLVPGAGAIPRYLGLLAVIVQNSEQAYDQLVLLKELVATMVREKRDPTPDEWSEWELRAGIAHDAIQNYDVETETEKPTP